MKKPTTFLFLFTLIVLNSFSQNNVLKPMAPNQGSWILTNFQNGGVGNSAKQKFNNKALGDTLHYEAFTDSLPASYSVVNFAANNFVWNWDTLNPVNLIPPIKSSTGATGFMSLPISFFNSTGNISMDTYFKSNKITITPKASVYLQYQIYIGTCCRVTDQVVLEVSLDNINWDPYDISFPVNTPNADTATAVTFETVNLSPTLANQSDFWYRVRVDGPNAGFIMLDDFAFVEGACNDVVLSNTYLEFNNTNYNYYPAYSQIPCRFFPALPFFGTIKADGACNQTGVGFNISVNHLNTPGGGPATGLGMVYTSINNIGNLMALTDTNVVSGTPHFTPNIYGNFEVNLAASSDSSDQVPSNNFDTWTFEVTDTIFAKDNNNFDGGVGPANYVDGATQTPGGTQVGDRFGTMYILENTTGNSSSNIPTSVTYFVSNNPRNIGVGIQPKIWEYNENSLSSGLNAAFGNEVASSFLTYTVTSSDTNSFITIPFTSGTALTGTGLDSGQYVVGWEVTNLPSGTTFEVANDVSIPFLKQIPITNFLYLGHASSQGWGWVQANPVIRLNMGNLPLSCFTASIKSTSSVANQFTISPNPSNGEFKLSIKSQASDVYNLNVRNMLGQMVFSSQVQVNGTKTERIDLSNLEKGVYFVTLENENDKLLKKVVLK